jgi:hypothetical protein
MYQEEPDGPWLESQEQIEVFQGGAVARQGQMKIIFAPNINAEGAIDMVGPEGKRFVSNVLSLSYFDAATGESVMIAEIKDSVGKIIEPNLVIYEDCFTDIWADVVYEYRRNGLMQSVILREQPPPPEIYGFDPETTRLEILTEFLQAPQPKVREGLLRRTRDQALREQMVEPDMLNHTLDFGALHIRTGKAFQFQDRQQKKPAMGVAKLWQLIDGRKLLFESVRFEEAQAFMGDLGAWTPDDGKAVADLDQEALRASVQDGRQAPESRLAHKVAEAETVKVVQADQVTPKGFEIDYDIVTSQSGMTFYGDTTYYVGDAVTLSGSTTFQGGAVIKYTNTTSAEIEITGNADFDTKPYRPVVFTSKFDDTIGEEISSSDSETPQSYGGYALNFDTYSSGVAYTVKNVRIRHANAGILLWGDGSTTHTMEHCQILRISNDAVYTYWTDLNAYNSLIYDVDDAFGVPGAYVTGEHVTVHEATDLYDEDNASTTFVLYNSLLADITTTQSYSGSGNAEETTGAGVFQTVRGGAHYLANTSGHRDAGITNITSSLLEDLKKRTTYPPVDLSEDITTDTTWSPQAQRDNDGQPDRGYHYDPIDYMADTLTVTNAVLTLTNGVDFAGYGNNGLWLRNGSTLRSTGKTVDANYLTRFHNVQELTTNWNTATQSTIIPQNISSTHPVVETEFTNFDLLSNGGTVMYTDDGNYELTSWKMRDCRFHGGDIRIAGSTNTTIELINNLWERIASDWRDEPSLDFYNNLLVGNDVDLRLGSGWILRDNIFDNCTVSETFPQFAHDHNAYVNGSDELSGTGSTDITLSSFSYSADALGDYYHGQTNLINQGSRSSSAAGLYHHTVETNQSKEAGSTVDIGFHYVPVDGNGEPVDTDEDTIPDYVEDSNGDGSSSGDDTSWTSYNSPNGLESPIEITVFSPLID